MEINWSIAGWIIAIIVLYLVGYYEGRSTGYKRRKREEEQEKLKTPPAPVDDPGVLRINNDNGNVTLDLDGARVAASALTSGQRNRLMDILSLIRPWLKDESTPEPVMATPSFPPQPIPFDQRFDEFSASTRDEPAPVQPAISTSPTIPITRSVASKASTLAKEDRPAAPKKTTDTQDDRPKPAAGSIVGQIDSILQTRMIGTPLAERRIYLAESPEGGVMVNVGSTKYMGIDDVPDDEIKSTIRAAIAEWEKKYTPGL
jgi:hypothetical protein